MSAKRWLLVATVLLILAVAASVIIKSYSSSGEDTRQSLEFSMGVVGGGLAAFGAFYAFVVQMHAAELARRSRSLEIIDQLNTLEMVQIRSELQTKLENSSTYVRSIDEDDKEKHKVKLVLGIFEDVALAIRAKIADERVLYDSLSFVVPHFAEKLESYFRSQRQKYEDDTIYEHVEKLAKAWRQQQSYGKPGGKIKAT